MSDALRPADRLYTDGDYARSHPDWHLSDAPAKAVDLTPGLAALLPKLGNKRLRIADVGSGVGGVLYEVRQIVRRLDPDVIIEAVGFEISRQAVEAAQRLFPDQTVRCKMFEPSDGPFDLVMFADVLEHVENPWQLLRDARAAARFLLVRQPLLEGFSTFRHDAYKAQREQWGHIGFFSYRFFMDMAVSTGWLPAKTAIVAPWELATSTGKGGVVQRLVTRANRPLASYLLSGFYLNGLFEGAGETHHGRSVD